MQLLSNRIQAVLVALAFILVALQGYLLQSPFVASNPYLTFILLLLPAVIFAVKELAGSSQPGILSPNVQAILMFIAFFLSSFSIAVTLSTKDPLYLFIGGLIAAVVAGLKEYLGSLPPTPVPTPLPAVKPPGTI